MTRRRTIKIDVLNDETTLEADTKLVKDALETMKLIGATDVDSLRVRRNEEQAAQMENYENLTPAESTSYRSLVMKLAYVAQDRVAIRVTRRWSSAMMFPWTVCLCVLRRTLYRSSVAERTCVLHRQHVGVAPGPCACLVVRAPPPLRF